MAVPLTGSSFAGTSPTAHYGASPEVLEEERKRFELQRTQADAERGAALGYQQGAMTQYENILRGNAPSVAQLQLQQGTEANVRAAMALAASGRGGNMAATSRQGMMGGVGANMALGEQSAMLRAQEQAQALQGYAGLGTTMAEQAGSRGMGYEGLMQGMNLAEGGLQTEAYRMRQEQIQHEQGLAFERKKEDERKRQFWASFGLDVGKSAAKAVGGAASGMGGA